MRLLEAVHGRTQALQRMFERFGILRRARGLVRGRVREVGDAAGVFVVRLGERADLGLERAEQLEQLALAVFADGFRAADFRLDFGDGVFDHDRLKH